MSMDTIMEDSDYSVSNTDAIIYSASDISGWTESLISDPNIPNSSSTSEDEYQQQQQQISTAADAVGGGDSDNLMIIVSSDESSGSTNNNKQIDQKIRIFNVELMESAMRPHECSICGLEFPTGQALGGHMRRHRAIITSEDEYWQQISIGDGGDDSKNDLMIIVSSESSRSTNNKQQIEQKFGNIFNVDSSPSTSARPRHECSICGLECSSGQALGGHMRWHRPIIMTENLQLLPQLVNQSNGRRVLCLDLNLTPLENVELKLGKADPIVNLFF